MAPPSSWCGKNGVANTCLSGLVLAHLSVSEANLLVKKKGKKRKRSHRERTRAKSRGGLWLALATTLHSSPVSVSCPV